MSREEQAAAVVELVAEGLSLRQACERIGCKAPSFLRWCDQDKTLAEQYARARATGADVGFEALHDLQSEQPPIDDHGKVDTGWVAWRRLQVDALKWSLSKKAPRKYGDSVTTTHELGDSVKEIVRTIVRAP